MEISLSIYHGDCLDVMKKLPDKSIDLIICDLPYGCLHPQRVNPEDKAKYKNMPGAVGCAWDIKIDLKAFWEQVKRIRKSDHTPTLHFATTKFGYEIIKSNEAEFRYDLVWDKGRGVSFLSANKMPMRSHEMIYVFSKAGTYYNRVDITGDFKANCGDKGGGENRQYGAERQIRPDNTGKRCVLSVIPHKTSSTKGGHPTEKPRGLYKWLIERYCPPGGTVLDPTAGSFNSVFTAYDMGRNAIGIENDDKFYKKAEESPYFL